MKRARVSEINFHNRSLILMVTKFSTGFYCMMLMQLQQLGENAIRLGVMWHGAEPTRGNYNSTYLDSVQSIVENAAKYEIYTLIGMHQDLLSEKFCGEGIPSWAVDLTSLNGEKGFPMSGGHPPAALGGGGVRADQ